MSDVTMRLHQYEALLRKWQKAINLVSPNTLPDLWERHFEDSLQLSELIEKNRTVYDIGSGAGFPGLVLAIARPDLKMTLIESDQRKCSFLRTVSRETNTSVTILNARIEAVAVAAPDIVTARALAPVDKLLAYTENWRLQNPALTLLLLKGENYQQELADCQVYQFDAKITASATDARAAILRLENIRKI